VSDVGEIRKKLVAAIEARDADAFESALAAAFVGGLPQELSDLLTAALTMPWHTRHEDLASAIQTMKSPASVEALFVAATAHYEYLDYDEFFALSRKCTWALADIGTVEARQKLAQLALNANIVIAGYAQKRLDHWNEELPRKGR
jgi:hypothetical protein